MANIKDVAKLAGVSIATVSNVFNESQKVKDSTKARVLRAAGELGYTGQGTALPPSGDKGKLIGVIAEDVSVFNTPAILNAICATAKERSLEVLISNLGMVSSAGTLGFDELECITAAKNSVNLFLANGAAGIIYVGCKNREIKYLCAGYSTPFVYAYCYSHENHAPSVVYDNENATHSLVKHLISLGHTNIGIIMGPENNEHVYGRLVGYQKAHFEAGILYNPGNLIRTDWDDPESGYRCVPPLLENQVTAIFCMNDTLAEGVFNYAHSHGIRLPSELSVVGFDNKDIASAFYPKLTTVAMPLRGIGEEAVRQMELLLSGKAPEAPSHIITLGCDLVLRDSVADIRPKTV